MASLSEIVISPTRGFRGIDIRELWAYRDLMWLFVWRDFVARYKQTLLGPLWHLLQPLITTVIFTVVFSSVAQLPTDGLPPPLFYLCGLLPWNYFAQTFTSTTSTLVANAALFGKVYFPRLVVPLSAVLSNLVSLGIQLASFLAVYALHRATHVHASYAMRWQALLLPLVVLHVAALSVGVGLWLAALTTRFRDLAVLSSFVIQLWMYVTPVIFPLARVPDRWRVWVVLNPMTAPVETFRYLLLGAGSVSEGLIALSLGMTVVALVGGVLVFQRVERTFIDVI
jgi:lipopolysaccharide transport system permease protein